MSKANYAELPDLDYKSPELPPESGIQHIARITGELSSGRLDGYAEKSLQGQLDWKLIRQDSFGSKEGDYSPLPSVDISGIRQRYAEIVSDSELYRTRTSSDGDMDASEIAGSWG